VLGNPRAAGRSLDDATFDPKKALVRWILPGGLRYAIADDFDRLPRDIRSNVDVLARFGPAAVVQRRGASVCEARYEETAETAKTAELNFLSGLPGLRGFFRS